MLDFIHFSVTDLIDILLVGLLIFQISKLIRGKPAMSIFLGVIFLYVIWLLTKALEMELLSSILGQVIGVGVLALIIVFQPEIRRFLLHLGNSYTQKVMKHSFFRSLMGTQTKWFTANVVDEIAQACNRMAQTRTGALIAIQHAADLAFVIETGDVLGAHINRRLIENIFFKNAPLHDGGMVIVNNRIQAARCTFPISENPDIPAHYGMRHRAAIGLSEQTDALVLVVSEETGEVTAMHDGSWETLPSNTALKLAIASHFNIGV